MDVFASEYKLTESELEEVCAHLDNGVFCSACDTQIADSNILRKHKKESIHSSMCIPCFLFNNTDMNDDTIQTIVKHLMTHNKYQ